MIDNSDNLDLNQHSSIINNHINNDENENEISNNNQFSKINLTNKKNKENINYNNNNVAKSFCSVHQSKFIFICYHCNELLCSECISIHLRLNRNHDIYHVNEIAKSMSQILLNEEEAIQYQINNNNINFTSETNFYYLKTKIYEIWSYMSILSQQYRTLQSFDDRITNFYTNLHSILQMEERKTKESIRTNQRVVSNDLQLFYEEMKSLLNIVNHSNMNCTEENIPANNGSQQSGSSSYSDLFNSPNFSPRGPMANISDLIKAIAESKSLNEFLNNNNRFNGILKNNNNVFIDNLSHDAKVRLLQMINIHCSNHTLNRLTVDLNPNIDKYVIKENKNLTTTLKEIIKDIIKVIPPFDKNIKRSYILSTHLNRGATLIDINDYNNFQFKEIEFKVDNDNYFTFNSMVKVKDFIYLFGGYNIEDSKSLGLNNFSVYSVHEEKIVIKGKMYGVSGGRLISVCYDESQNYIYLIGGYNAKENISEKDRYLSRIDRFNLNTMTFERVNNFENIECTIVLSFYHQGQIYIVPKLCYNKIFVFDIVENKVHERYFNLNTTLLGCCYDGINTLYLYTEKKQFFKYRMLIVNVKEPQQHHQQQHEEIIRVDDSESNEDNFSEHEDTTSSSSQRVVAEEEKIEVEYEKPIELNSLARLSDPFSMLYHRVSKYENNIFILNRQGNYIYYTESNQWKTFLGGDNQDRLLCGCYLYTI